MPGELKAPRGVRTRTAVEAVACGARLPEGTLWHGCDNRTEFSISRSDRYPYILRIAKSTICSTAFASNTIRCSPSMSRTKP